MLTEVASSIMAASLPISQGPKLSPRSQLRSIVVMMVVRFGLMDLGLSGPWLVAKSYCQKSLPGSGVDRADRVSGDISIPERLDVEIKIRDSAPAIGQGAQQLCEFS